MALAALACALLSGRASAQDQGATGAGVAVDPATAGRFHWGPLHFTPAISVTGVGIDTNVFNDTVNRQEDTTAAVGPIVEFWMRAGRARIHGQTGAQYLYFQEFSNQRAWNTGDSVRVDVPGEHFTPFAEVIYANERTRPGFEIDTRTRQMGRAGVVGTDIPLSARTTLSISETIATTAFDEDDGALGALLSARLDRSTSTTRAQLQYRLTPLTTFVLNTDLVRDRFATESDRDANSVLVMPGFHFKPFALIAGTASIGFRHLTGLSDSLPQYDGLIASVGASYHIAATLVSVDVDRDISYSSLEINPYYVLNNVQLSVMQRLTSVWDIGGRGGWQTLAYKRDASLPPTPEETDTLRQYGAGVGYRVGRTLRLGFDTIYSTRYSYDLGRNYTGFRAGFSVTYGL